MLPKRLGPVVGLANKLLAGAPKPLAAVVVVPNAGFELNRLEPCNWQYEMFNTGVIYFQPV